jgi:Fe(3+) dicitrate transport protein
MAVVALAWAVPVWAQEAEAGAGAGTETEAGAGTETESESGAETDDAWLDEEDDLTLTDLVVEGVAEAILHTGGSVHVMDEETLAEMNYDDVLSVLPSVPGVYVRQEDGYGLRPNIGMRGASAERSRRVTLMEDGVLLGPAPYSAPAAYYFPLTTRITGIEVFLGPAAIAHGPHTVGGAIDFHDRAIPLGTEGGLDLALGTTWLGRFHGHIGTSNEWGGLLAEVVHLRTDGFRQLDFASQSDSTGFDRTDVMLRGEVHGDLSADAYHRLEATFGLGLENSNETYLGLAQADFDANPLRRYGITSSDRMEWWRTRAQLRYELLSSDVDLVVTAYRHDMDRTWRRLDRFRDGTGLYDVLSNPDDPGLAPYYAVLTGEERPSFAALNLIRVNNRRVFISEGVQANARFRFRLGELASEITAGARLHHDEIARLHTGEDIYAQDAQLIVADLPVQLLTDNRAQSIAVSAFAAWQFRFLGLTITPGARLELIFGEFADRRPAELMAPTDPVFVRTTQAQLLPGLGLTYDLAPPVSLFAGVYQGYSPVAPGQPSGVRPELAWNYELGARYGRTDQDTHGQLSFFLSDYQNLTGECSGAGGCPVELVDRQFNGDRATILGLEATARHSLRVDEFELPFSATYTWTYTRLRTAFVSESPSFGAVEVGDHLPYVPEHQASFRVGARWRMLSLDANALYVGVMRDEASRGPQPRELLTDEQFYLDAVARVEVYEGVSLYVRAENLLDARPVVSRRPFGARTGRPLLVQAGLEAAF